jgi:hypothetical protein
MPEPDMPRLAWPPRFDPVSGSALVDQGSPEEIQQCVGVVCVARPGRVIEVPAMGIHDQAFRQGGVDLAELESAVATWEPRAPTTMTASEIVEAAQSVGINIKLEGGE